MPVKSTTALVTLRSRISIRLSERAQHHLHLMMELEGRTAGQCLELVIVSGLKQQHDLYREQVKIGSQAEVDRERRDFVAAHPEIV